MDRDLILVDTDEVIRSKAVRKTGEFWDGHLLLNAKVGPWDLKRGVRTNVDSRPMQPPTPQPIPTVPEDALKEKKKRVVDEDAAAVRTSRFRE